MAEFGQRHELASFLSVWCCDSGWVKKLLTSFLGNNSSKLFPWPGGSSDRVHDMRGQSLNKGKEAFRQILSNK